MNNSREEAKWRTSAKEGPQAMLSSSKAQSSSTAPAAGKGHTLSNLADSPDTRYGAF